ncbi:transcription factor MAMYB [Diospyros lotus]|uniref:transcription factor MAMYB n=1 Tax=Diospyros lotus TaxID=55363 RepID=UPI002250628E|nr:transcription factor MAMYB [Diospyros lotus]
MEFLDEEARPRLLFQSRPVQPSSAASPALDLRRPSVLVSLSLSALLFGHSLFFLQSEPLQSILLWFALSFLLGPFAPSSLTAGDIRVGLGQILEPPPPDDVVDQDDPKKKPPNRRLRPRKNEEPGFVAVPAAAEPRGKVESGGDSTQCKADSVIGGEEREWSEGDVEVLKKLLVKHPVGKPKRWEEISAAFQGRHGVESVIKMAKSMGEKRTSDADSFTQFLKDRKPVDKRIEAESEAINKAVESGEAKKENLGLSWSARDDVALLNALKAFPKDVAMRWEKIAAAVPGKSKAACMKRVTELKRDFRNSKTSVEAS